MVSISRRLRYCGAIVIATGTVFAVAGGAKAQSISYVPGASNDFTWAYDITSARKPAISHFVFGICKDACDSLLSVQYLNSMNMLQNASYECMFSKADPTTGKYGLKVDYGFQDNETTRFFFTFDKAYEPATVDVTFKSGGGKNLQIVTKQVTGPSCDPKMPPPPPPPPSQAIPEPGTMALASAGLLPLIGIVRRRRNAK